MKYKQILVKKDKEIEDLIMSGHETHPTISGSGVGSDWECKGLFQTGC